MRREEKFLPALSLLGAYASRLPVVASRDDEL
jgi:hypothetical protein